MKAVYFYEAVENHIVLIGNAAYTLQVHIVSIPPKICHFTVTLRTFTDKKIA